MINKIQIPRSLLLPTNKYILLQKQITMKKSISLIAFLFISLFFMSTIGNAHVILQNNTKHELSVDDTKKDKKRNNAIKTKVTEREKPPVTDNKSASVEHDQAYNYMNSPKLEDCTKPDFDRE